jgi:hypothetical protein
VQHRVQHVGVDPQQDPSDRGQARWSAPDPEARPGPAGQVRGPPGDPSQAPRAGHHRRDGHHQHGGQLVASTAPLA